MFGIGSAYAFFQALRAKRHIEESGGALSGRGRVWWCLIVGALGMALWPPILAIGVSNQFQVDPATRSLGSQQNTLAR